MMDEKDARSASSAQTTAELSALTDRAPAVSFSAPDRSAQLAYCDAAWRYEREPANRAGIGAMAKIIASELVSRPADQTVQQFGGEGCCKDRPIERIWPEIRVIRILEGTSEVMRDVVARGLLRQPRRRLLQDLSAG